MAAKAAKAVGLDIEFDTESGRAFDGKSFEWRPHIDDGDSRRLQVALDIDIRINDEIWPDKIGCLVVCPRTFMAFSIQEPYTDGMTTEEKLAAVRLAVLRVAARIGRAMP